MNILTITAIAAATFLLTPLCAPAHCSAFNENVQPYEAQHQKRRTALRLPGSTLLLENERALLDHHGDVQFYFDILKPIQYEDTMITTKIGSICYTSQSYHGSAGEAYEVTLLRLYQTDYDYFDIDDEHDAYMTLLCHLVQKNPHTTTFILTRSLWADDHDKALIFCRMAEDFGFEFQSFEKDQSNEFITYNYRIRPKDIRFDAFLTLEKSVSSST